MVKNNSYDCTVICQLKFFLEHNNEFGKTIEMLHAIKYYLF